MAQWTKPYKFRHYEMSVFSLYVNGKRVPSEDLTVDMDHEKTSVMGDRTLFEGSGIHLSISGVQIKHDIYINNFFMLIFDLTPDRRASEANTSLPDNDNIRIEMLFSKPLPESITCLLYLEYDSTVLVNLARKVTTDYLNQHGHQADSVYAA
jgi:hypothetical protein